MKGDRKPTILISSFPRPKHEKKNVHVVSGKPGMSAFGLSGVGELVAVGDTGLDSSACFFFDPDRNVTSFADPINATLSNHRKVPTLSKTLLPLDRSLTSLFVQTALTRWQRIGR